MLIVFSCSSDGGGKGGEVAGGVGSEWLCDDVRPHRASRPPIGAVEPI